MVLPPLDESFAKPTGDESLEKLGAGVRRDLENELSFKQNKSFESTRRGLAPAG